MHGPQKSAKVVLVNCFAFTLRTQPLYKTLCETLGHAEYSQIALYLRIARTLQSRRCVHRPLGLHHGRPSDEVRTFFRCMKF